MSQPQLIYVWIYSLCSDCRKLTLVIVKYKTDTNFFLGKYSIWTLMIWGTTSDEGDYNHRK